MKVLQLVNIGYEAGGAERSVHLLQQGLRRRGHEVVVVATDKELGDQVPFADVIVPRPSGSPMGRALRHTWNGQMARTVGRVVDSFRPDLVHLHTIGDFSPAIFSALGDTPAVHTVHGPEEYTRALQPWHLPASDYTGGSYRPEDLRASGRLRLGYYRSVQRPLYRFGLRKLRLLIGPSAYMAHTLHLDSGPVPTRHVPNGIVLPPPVPLSPRPHLLFVGRLEAVKGVDYLVRAMQTVLGSVPDATLTVVGDGGARLRLEALVAALGMTRSVTFTGWAGPAALGDLYADSRIFVIPSVWPENMPTVAIEAMAFGRPLIGTNVGGIPELVEPGVNGWLVEPGDIDALARAIVDALAGRRDLEAMGNASRAKAGQFDIEDFVDTIECVYAEVLAA